MRVLAVTLLPLLLLAGFAESLGDDLLTSIGRLAYFGAMLNFVWAVCRFIRPASSIMQSLKNEHSDGLIWRGRWVWTG